MNKNFDVRAKTLKREYQRVWRLNNPEKIKMYQEKYWIKKAKDEYEKEVNNRDTNEND